MATVRDICERALRRIRVASAVDPVAPEDAAIARGVLNSMLAAWPASGVEPFYADLEFSEQFRFLVPPETAPAELISRLVSYGTWDASTNTPTLAPSVGTTGSFYRVTVAGSTILDNVSSWAVGDYLVFSGVEWLKCPSSARFDQSVIDLLALELCNEFGKEPTAILARSASRGWSMIQAAYIKAPMAGFDRALRDTYIRGGMGSEPISQNNGGADTDVYLIDD